MYGSKLVERDSLMYYLSTHEKNSLMEHQEISRNAHTHTDSSPTILTLHHVIYLVHFRVVNFQADVCLGTRSAFAPEEAECN